MTEPGRHAVVASTVFDGEACHADYAVIVEDRRISGLLPKRELAQGLPARVLPEGAWLAPGFIDIQVNGGGDVLLNDDPSAAAMATIARAHRKFGTTALLPTLITDTPEKMRAALTAASQAGPANPSVLGIHIEGPFISPEKPGVHSRALIRAPNPDDIEMLIAPRAGLTLVTLAPECVPSGFIARLAKAGVRVSLGHSMATYDETKAALAEGLTGFTHLFNAMRPLGSRAPGPIAAALETRTAFFGMIVDGEHVDPAMLRLALRGVAHPMLDYRCDASGGRKQTHICALWRADCGSRRPVCEGRRHACRRRDRHGERRAKLREPLGCATHASSPLCVHGACNVSWA